MLKLPLLRQIVHEAWTLPLPVVELDSSQVGKEQVLNSYVEKAVQQSFDLSQDLMLRGAFLVLNAKASEADHRNGKGMDGSERYLLLVMHHAISDHWTLDLLLTELTALCEERCEERCEGECEERCEGGLSAPLPTLPIQYADFALWQQRQFQQRDFQSHLDYWTQQLSGEPTILDLPLDHSQHKETSRAGQIQRLVLSPHLLSQLKTLSQQHNATLFMTLLAAFKVLLYRYTQQTDIIVGVPVAGRQLQSCENLLGCFLNTLAFRTNLAGGPSFALLLQSVRTVSLEAYAHQHCPFEKVIEQLQIERDFSQSPLFNVVFDYINTPQSAAVESDNLPLTPVKVDRRVALFDLTLYLEETAQGFEILFEYSQVCFEPATISRMKAHFQTLLESIVADPSQSIDRLMLLTPAARQQQLFAWNQTQTDYPRNECVHELFEAQVARQPSAIAATLNQQKITYQQLNQRANQLARYLQTLGAQPGSLIGLYLNRSLEMLVGMLAILKAGGAYVTLDPEYPAERLTFMLEDTQISILLGQASLSQNSPFQSRATLIDLEGALEQNCSFLGSFSYNNLPCNTTPEDLAYVIYTSGSTGRPKGVTIPHRAVNRLVCQTNYIDIQPSDRVAQVSNASFDAAPFEIWSALLNGAQLVLIDKAVLLSPRAFSAQLREHRVSSLLLTTALFNQVASVRPETFSGLRYLLFGGEAADPKWVRTVLEKGKPQRLIHAYGPAENTTISTCYEVTAVSEADTTVPIGTPIANTQVYILSDRLEPVPMGVVGELYVGGDGLARGYLNRPELTAERFVHHPFSAAPNARLYKTGDLARYLADGEIEFIGRKDHQVKIRGFRIELGEIGTVLAQHPLVGDELIVVQDLPNGEKRLVAYVTPREASPSSRDLRQFLQTRLPGYMVPSAFTVLDRFPLTPNGKVDRQALPEPAEGLLANKGDFVAPRTKTEKQLGQIWCELLHLDAVGLRDSFFELGGHSLLATRLSSQIQDVFAVEIPLKTVFESPTLEELSMVVEEAIAQPSHSAQKVTIPTASREERLSLSFAQQRLWFLNQLENKAQSTTYNITCTLQLEGLLVASVLKQAISEIVQRHESLRTVFPLEGNEPVQRVLSAASVHIPVADLQLSTEFEQIEQIGRLVDELGRTPFDLGGSRPLISFSLVKRSAQQHVLIMAMHHIISDGWSVDIFKRELSALYHDFTQGKSASLPALSVQYADFAHWQRQQLQGDRLTEQLAYWQQQLADAPKLLTFPTDYSRPPVQDFAGAAIAFKLDSDLSQQLAELSAKNGTTLYMTLLAAFSTLLYRYSHAEDIVVGSPIANRTQRDIEPLIGFFANTLPMRTRLGDNPSFLSLLEQVKQTALAAYEHQDLPFEKLVEVLNPERTLSYHPVFQVVFSLQNESPLALTTPSLTIRDWEKAHSKIAVGDRAKFDLGLSMVATADGLEGTWRYATALFESETIHRLQVAFQTLLSSIVEQPETPVSKLSILSEADRQKLLFDWTNTRADYPRDQAVHQLFEQQVALTPDAIAVRFKDCSLTYTALNQRANQLAHYLKDLDIEPGDLIGLYMERSLEMIVSIVAILKAGGAYVPLDTSYPSERIAFILQDSKVSILLTQSHLSMAVAEIVSQVVEVDRLFLSDHDATSRSNLFLNPVSVQKTFEDRPADQLAYVMYTSGSTGTPKGVCVRHRSISRLVKNTNFVSIDSEDVFLQLAPIAFDAATFSIWGALLNGASVVLFPHAKPSPETIAETVAKHQVTMFFVTAGLFHVMVDHGLKGLESTRQMLFGGDVTSVAHVRQARSQLPNCTFINGYGPTENTTFTTCYPVPRTAPIEQPIPIGYPISNTCTYVLDEHLQPVPIGVYGELYAGGDGVAAGYLHRPELTQERFIQNPFSQDGADTLYKTGDLARYRADGSIEFAGRLDHQVKVRGFRIELGEIETALERHPQLEKTVVVVWERQPGDKRLIVYMTCLGRPPSSRELSRFLKQSLPSYMVPATFIAVEQLPLTPNGKVDRRSLPQPDHFVRELDTDLVEPQTQLQAQLAAIWQKLLSLDAVGIHDNFFELGGHSLLATQVISRVRTALSVALPVRSLFEEPTIAGLAALIEAGHRSSREVPELSAIEPASRDLSLPLSFAQQRLWFLSQLEETGATYNVPTVLELSGPLDSAALERAVYTIAQRHEVLRTTFQLVDGQPMQLIHDELPLELPKIDLRSHPLQKQTDTVRQLSNQLAHTPFDLSQDFPLRAQLIQLERESHVLILVLHHIVADGWSMSIFLRELVLLYREQAEGVAAALAPLPIQYADFAYWQRQWLQGEVRSRQLSYWQQQLAGAPERLMLPVDYDYPTVRSPKGATLTFQLSPALTRQLNRLSQQRETTLFMTLLAAFSVFLYRYSDRYSQQGQPATDIVVGTPIANRNRQEIEPLIGFFANTLLMRTKVENNPRFSEVLQQVRQGALEAYAHQDLPFEMLVEVLRPARTLSHNPLFQVMFALQTAAGQQREQPSEPLGERQTNNLPCRPHPKSLSQSPHPKSLSQRERDFRSDSLLPSGEGLGMRALEISQTDTPLKRTSLSDQQNSSQARSLSIRKREVEWNAAKFDLNLSMTKTEKGLKGRWNYSTDLFKPETASFMVNQFQALLESIVATPDQPVDELSLLSAQAQQTLAQSQQKSARLAAKIATLSPAKRSLLEQKLRSQQKGRQSADMLPRQRQSVGSPNGANGTGWQSAELTITEAPLSFSQQNLWLLDQLNPGNPAFNRPTHIRLAGNLDISALEASLAALVRRHDVLRTHFQLSSAGEPVQIISPRLPAEISLVETLEDISHLPASEQTDALKRQAIAQAHTLFDLTALPLFKLRLLRLSDTEHILLWTFHHIIFDGWSTGILIKDLAALYQAAMTGQPADLPPLAIQYADFALRQQRSLKTAAMATQLAYWKKQLSGHLPILELPTDRPRRSAVAKGAETKGAEYTFELSQSLKHQLSTFAQREQSTLFMVLLAGFKTLLYRYTQAEDVIVGSPIAGRNAVETENLIGLFFNTLVLRSQPTGAQSFQLYLQQVRQTALDAYAHQDIPLPKLVEALQIERDPSRSNLFQVLFQFKNLPSEAVGADGAAGGLSFSDSRLETDIASLELALEISEQAEGLSCLVKYDAALFDGATIQRMGEHFRTLLESALKNPRQSLDALLLLPAAERQRLLQWSSAEADLPGQPQVDTGCIHRLFEAQVLRQPGAIALTYQQQQLTYQALNRRANQLAHRLSKLGVGPDVPVGIYLARSPDLLIALLAVLKAGGAYVPLDADALPIERVTYVLADTQAPVLITHSELCEALPTSTAAQVFTQICVDTDQAEIALESAENLADFASPTDLAYVIYTSGSTGQPKGTMVEHHSLVDAFWSWEQAYQLPQLGSHLQLAGFSFDVFTADWVRSLCSGAELVLCPADYRLVPQKLYHLLQTAQIACAEFVPGVIRLLMQHLTETGQSLDFMQLLIVGSDTWYMREYRQLQAVCGAHTRLVNSYGLTEDTVDSTFFESAQPEGLNGQRPELAEDALVPIGRPFANTQLHILDGQLQPVPIGIPGELYISGSGLARGYLNRAELTAQRFMEPAGYPRLYKTGDRARYLNDGNVEFLGRLDFQVKLRGFRIELGEIEAALARSPEVQQCVVVLRADGADQQRLIAYWMPVTRQSQTVTPNELKQRLKQSLPDYMVPAAFVALDAFPLTPSGKINRQALPTPDPTQRTSDAAFVAPRSPTEQQLAQIWCELLNLEQVSIHDDFFDLGGHSLLAVHLVARIRQTFNSELPLSSLFRDKSIAQLATRLTPAVESAATKDGTEQPPAHTPLVEIQPSPRSLPVFFVHPIGGSVFCYQALADQLATDRAIYGLQAPTMTNDLRYQSIENMATDYIQAIRRVQPKGPYQLGGWSMGGVIAYEMAQQLAKQGDEVLPIVMIDSRVPTGNTGENISTGRPSKRLMVLFARDLGCSVSQTQQIDRALNSPDASASAERAIARLYVALQQFERLPPTLSQSELQHLLQLFTYHLNMLKSYTPRSYAGSVTLFKAQTPVRSTRAADDTGDRTWPQDFGWRQLVQGALVVHTVPGSHYSMMRSPTVATLADRLSQFLMQYSSRLPCSP
ncbi:MAG: amino acid adenylation domain-containing protein [Cyanobacteria bacterium J06626_6]